MKTTGDNLSLAKLMGRLERGVKPRSLAELKARMKALAALVGYLPEEDIKEIVSCYGYFLALMFYDVAYFYNLNQETIQQYEAMESAVVAEQEEIKAKKPYDPATKMIEIVRVMTAIRSLTALNGVDYTATSEGLNSANVCNIYEPGTSWTAKHVELFVHIGKQVDPNWSEPSLKECLPFTHENLISRLTEDPKIASDYWTPRLEEIGSEHSRELM